MKCFIVSVFAVLTVFSLINSHNANAQTEGAFTVDAQQRYVGTGNDIGLSWACDFSVADFSNRPMDVYLAAIKGPALHDQQINLGELMPQVDQEYLFLMANGGRQWLPLTGWRKNPTYSNVTFSQSFNSGTINIPTASGVAEGMWVFCATLVPSGKPLSSSWPIVLTETVTVGTSGQGVVGKMEGWFPKNIKGMCYQPGPTDYYVPGTPVKYGNTDFANSDFKALWGTDGTGKTRTVHFPGDTTANQGDLQTMKDMGVNLVRIYGWQSGNDGTNPWVDHHPFLDECDKLGIKVIVPIWMDYSDDSYNNISWTVSRTKDYDCVVMYSVGNEISQTVAGGGANPAWDLMKKFVTKLKEVMSEKGATKQLIICPTWPSEEAMGWFLDPSNGIPADVWAFNAYDPNQVNNIHGMASNRLVHGKPYFFSEFGVDAYNTNTNLQVEGMQKTGGNSAMQAVAQSGNQCFGGCWFEWSDERNKGLRSSLGAGGGADGTSPASTYVSQIGGNIDTYVGGPTEPVPAGSIGTCTYGWTVCKDWFADEVANEGYFGMCYFADTGKTAETVKLEAYPPGGGKFPYIYRVDDLYFRSLYNDYKSWNPKP